MYTNFAFNPSWFVERRETHWTANSGTIGRHPWQSRTVYAPASVYLPPQLHTFSSSNWLTILADHAYNTECLLINHLKMPPELAEKPCFQDFPIEFKERVGSNATADSSSQIIKNAQTRDPNTDTLEARMD